MSRSKTVTLLALSLTVAAMAQAGSVEEARRLYENGETAAAKDELLEILALESDGAVRAEALDLLGMVAVDAGDLELATAVWEQLISDYPDSPLAAEAKTKLSLAADLSEARAEATEVSPKDAQAQSEVESRGAPVGEPDEEVATQPVKAAPAAPPPGPAAATEEVALVPQPQIPRSGVVLVAGRGQPHDGAQRAAEVVIEHLQSQGVAAVSATQGVPVVEDSTTVIPALLRQVEEQGANSLLMVTSNFVTLAKVVTECYTPEGTLAWKKKVTGGTGWVGRPYSATGMNENLVDRMLDKLDKQVGDPCLPVAE